MVDFYVAGLNAYYVLHSLTPTEPCEMGLTINLTSVANWTNWTWSLLLQSDKSRM